MGLAQGLPFAGPAKGLQQAMKEEPDWGDQGAGKQGTKETKTRRRMARERRGAGSSLVSMETPYYKTIY